MTGERFAAWKGGWECSPNELSGRRCGIHVETHCNASLRVLNYRISKRFPGIDQEHRILPQLVGRAFLDDGDGGVAELSEARLCEHFLDEGALEAEVVNAGRVVVEGAVFLVQVGDADDPSGEQELVKEPEERSKIRHVVKGHAADDQVIPTVRPFAPPDVAEECPNVGKALFPDLSCEDVEHSPGAVDAGDAPQMGL